MSLTTLDAIRQAKAKINAEPESSDKTADVREVSEENLPNVETPTDTDVTHTVESESVNEESPSKETSDDELSEWKAKYKALEEKMVRQQEALTRQNETAKKSFGQQLLAQQNINEALSKEVEHWKKQAKSQDCGLKCYVWCCVGRPACNIEYKRSTFGCASVRIFTGI